MDGIDSGGAVNNAALDPRDPLDAQVLEEQSTAAALEQADAEREAEENAALVEANPEMAVAALDAAESAEMFSECFADLFATLAPAWHVKPSTCAQLGRVWGRVMDHYIGKLKVPEDAQVLVVAALVTVITLTPKLRIPRGVEAAPVKVKGSPTAIVSG